MCVHRYGGEGDANRNGNVNNDDNDNGDEQDVNSDEEIEDGTNENENEVEVEEDLPMNLSHLNSNGNNNDNSLRVQSRRLELELQHAYDTILNIVSTTTTHETAATIDINDSRSNTSLQLSQLSVAQQSVLNLAFQQQQQQQAATATDASTDNSATRGTTPTLSSAAAALTGIKNNIQHEQLRYQQMTMNGSNNQHQLSLHEILVNAIIAYDEQLNREVDELFPSLEQNRNNNHNHNNSVLHHQYQYRSYDTIRYCTSMVV
mmetsp:Transcript_48757/g.54309  ORF Transcript_48757/g.54309 Transcript_48757/m.54309 type:complete len:261 (+) Transcript_48757:124-906(+)